jgi:ATP-dependent Clp protease ATP-binding subunit ClpC
LLDDILKEMGTWRPWQIYFALSYMESLDPRPPAGASVVIAREWWSENLAVVDFYRSYFNRREAYGDVPEFGEYLNYQYRVATQQIENFLQKLTHPFARGLLQNLIQWQQSRIDREFLSAFGQLWNKDDDEGLLIEPEAWREQLEHAQAAILHNPPRSVIVVGEPRIGKTTFIKLVATYIRNYGWTVFEAGAAELMADQSLIGQLEGRVQRLIGELNRAPADH